MTTATAAETMRFETYEAGCAHCARIRGDIETKIVSKSYNNNNWQAIEEIILPVSGEIPFTYATCGTENYYEEYIATPQGIKRIS